MKKELLINADIVLELQRLCAEVDSKKELLAFMIDKGFKLDNERFKEYQDQYREDFFAYEQAKKEFQKNYLEAEFGKENLVRWNLDFDTNICDVEVKDN